MKRRSFLRFLGLAPLAPKVEVEKCKGCGEYGHQWTMGTIRDKHSGWFGRQESIAWWCPNAPVNWDLYERVR